MKNALIENGRVTNVILGSSPGYVPVPDSVAIGDEFDGENFSRPTPAATVPLVVTMRQARLALLGGGLLQTVNDAVAAAGGVAAIEWEYAQEVRRDWPTLIALQGAIGLSDAQIDALFVAAAAL